MKRNRVFGGIVFVIGLLVLLTPRFILPVCEFAGRSKMLCTETGFAEMFVGGIIMAIGLGLVLSVGRDAMRGLMLVAFVTGITVIAIPNVLGYCPSNQMPCNYGTIPMLRLLGVVLVIGAVVGFALPGKGSPPTAKSV